MSTNVQAPAHIRLILFASAGLVSVALLLLGRSPVTVTAVRADEYQAQDPVGADPLNPNALGQDPGDDEIIRFAPKSKTKAARKKGRASTKGTTKKGDAAKKKDGETPAKEEPMGELKFSQDIAPILAKNCSGCHSGTGRGLTKGKLELTTFEKMMKGTPGNPKIVSPGKPEESSLVLRLRGEGGAKMPQGGQSVLSDAAIAKIEQWVKAGATLDQGIDPKTAMDSYAPTPDQMARRELAKLTQQERDKNVEVVGLDRWKKANAKSKIKPEIIPGTHFIMFTSLPADRGKKDVAILDRQYNHLKAFLGAPTMDWLEKVSLFVFADRKDFVEFVRSMESREIEAEGVSTARLSGAQPYVAAVDPLGAKKEEPTKRRGRTKRGEEKDSGGRTVAGLLTEALGSAVYGSAAGDKPAPRWLKEGFGAYLASQVEPRNSYYRQLRKAAVAVFQQGWETKAAEVLGGSDKMSADDVHAVSFALVEGMMSSELRQSFPAFLNGMLGGTDQLDEMLKKVYGYTNRDEFLNDTGEFVATRYGQDE